MQSCLHNQRVIHEASEGRVAMGAQKPPHPAGAVAMVHAQPGAHLRLATADGAYPPLRIQELLVVTTVYSVATLELIALLPFSVCHRVFGSVSINCSITALFTAAAFAIFSTPVGVELGQGLGAFASATLLTRNGQFGALITPFSGSVTLFPGFEQFSDCVLNLVDNLLI